MDLIDFFPDGVLVVSDGCITRANVAAATLLGYPLTEMPGLKVNQLVPEHARVRHEQLVHQFSKKPVVRQMHYTFFFAVRKDGVEVPVTIMLAPCPEGVLVVLRDATALQRLTAAVDNFCARIEALKS